MADQAHARELATVMVDLGEAAGVSTTALLTRMDTVLGNAVGNAVEVHEAVQVLSGGGPADVRELTLVLANEMLNLVEVDADPAQTLDNGTALRCFEQMIAAQGGDLAGLPCSAAHVEMVKATRSGWVQRLDARSVGVASWRLGAGRSRKEDSVSATAGVVCHAKPGDRVDEGDTILELRTDDGALLSLGLEALADSIDIGDAPPPRMPLVVERIGR